MYLRLRKCNDNITIFRILFIHNVGWAGWIYLDFKAYNKYISGQTGFHSLCAGQLVSVLRYVQIASIKTAAIS